MTTRPGAFGAVLMLLMALSGTAQAKEPWEYTAINRFGRPVTPLPGFMEELLHLDRNTGYIRQPAFGWHPFDHADVWVFFLENPEEIALLGHYAPRILQELQVGDTAIANEIFLTLGERGERIVMLQYIYVSRYSIQNLEIMVCRAAGSVYADLDGWDNPTREAYTRACETRG